MSDIRISIAPHAVAESAARAGHDEHLDHGDDKNVAMKRLFDCRAS